MFFFFTRSWDSPSRWQTDSPSRWQDRLFLFCFFAGFLENDGGLVRAARGQPNALRQDGRERRGPTGPQAGREVRGVPAVQLVGQLPVLRLRRGLALGGGPHVLSAALRQRPGSLRRPTAPLPGGDRGFRRGPGPPGRARGVQASDQVRDRLGRHQAPRVPRDAGAPVARRGSCGMRRQLLRLGVVLLESRRQGPPGKPPRQEEDSPGHQAREAPRLAQGPGLPPDGLEPGRVLRLCELAGRGEEVRVGRP